jgi:DNA primase
VIPPSFVQELLARIDIVEVVGRHVELRKAGINHKGLCPFHGEKTPSFTVSATRQTYHCFGCGVHGNAIGFLMEHASLGFVDAVHDLAQQVGLTVPDDDSTPEERTRAAKLKERQGSLTQTLARAGDHYRAQLKASPRAVEYLKRRGLTGEIAARFALGYAPDGWRSLASAFAHYDDPLLEEGGLVIVQGETDGDRKRYDRFRDRIMFPIRSVQGDVIGFGGRVIDQGEPKYLNSPETPVFSKGRELYGLYEARQAMREHGFVLVVEGYMDVVALAQLGFPNAVATLGTACTTEHVQKLFRFADSVVFSFDGDAAGRRAAGRALEAALPHASDTRTVRFLFLPVEHDPDSYIREHGREAFERCIEQAVPLSRQLVEVAREGCDLDQAEGRARFLALAKPMWAALPDGALRRQLLGELARLGQLDVSELVSLWRAGDRSGAPPRAHAGGRPELAVTRAVSRRTRSAPIGPAGQALRLLLLHSDWWERLSAEDHDLLHQAPGAIGELSAWLERFIANHGPAPWASLEAALGAHPLLAAAQQAMTAMAIDDVVDFDDLRRVMNLLWIQHLEPQTKALAEQAGTDTEARSQLKALRERIDALKQAVMPRPEGPHGREL